MVMTSSGPEVINVVKEDGKSVFEMKVYKAEDAPIYEVTCIEVEEKGWFWRVSILDECEVTNVPIVELI